MQNQKDSCHRCGTAGHKSIDCPAINMKCINCQKLGHFARVCHSTIKYRKPGESQKIWNNKKNKQPKRVRAIGIKDLDGARGNQRYDSQSEEEFVLCINGQDSRVQVLLNSRKIKMVADTGCKQNLIASQLYREQFKPYPREKTTKQFVASA